MASAQHDICAICLEQPKNPKSLPTCTHLFCEACLNNYVRRHQAEGSVSCPTCTMACPTQDINIEAPAVAEPISRPTTKELCTFCSYKGLIAKAEFFCDRCEDALLCQDCAVSHGKKPRFRGHGAKPLSDFIKLARCTRHEGRAMKFLCMGCDKPACEICADIEHDDHELVDIGETLKKLKNNLEPLGNAYECASTLQRELEDVRYKEEAVVTLIQNRAALMKKVIDKRKDDLVSAVRAKAGGKQIDADVCRLVENLQGSLERGRDISAVGITNAEQVRDVLGTEETLNKTIFDASKKIAAFKTTLHDVNVPRFVQRKDVIIVGELEYLPKTKTEPVRLELGGNFARNPCYKIGKAAPFTSTEHKLNQGAVSLSNVAFFVQSGRWGDWSLQMTGLGKQIAEVKDVNSDATDMTVDNSGKLLLLSHGGIYQFIPPAKQDDENGSLQLLKEIGGYPCAVSVALTKTGQYILLYKNQGSNATVSILTADFELMWGPIKLNADTLPPEKDNRLKILCPESTDLLLITDEKGEKVSAVSLAVKREQRVGEAVGVLTRYFARRSPILPPVKGFFILDICCDNGNVYLCIKRETSRPTAKSPAYSPVQFYQATARPPEADPIKFYQATYTNDKWQYTAIPLEDPTGKPFSELKKDVMLQLGAHKGTLMCLVYSPIPLAELRESAEPGMNLTWYRGKLP